LAPSGADTTDRAAHYVEASCTAAHANFITGELPIRTGLTNVDQSGSPTGIPAQAPSTATVLKNLGYATGPPVSDRNAPSARQLMSHTNTMGWLA
jgi:hypothetical protein